ncbi:MAG: RCC1 domain-containing protein [Bradymonadaceae bacterium]
MYVHGLDEAVAISAHAGYGGHTCATKSTGTIYCWGKNSDGQLGNGRDGVGEESLRPTEVVDIETAVSAPATGGLHTCSCLESGEVRCWGKNQFGVLGLGQGEAPRDTSTPQPVRTIDSAGSVSAGEYHACARLDDGGVSCWGANRYGKLGNGRRGLFAVSHSPTRVQGLEASISTMAAGVDHTCASTESGQVLCWGANHYGQLGNGTSGRAAGSSADPVETRFDAE